MYRCPATFFIFPVLLWITVLLALTEYNLTTVPTFSYTCALCWSYWKSKVPIGVNAAEVAGVATPIFDLQGSSCVDDPRYFDKCFIFPSCGTSEYHKSLSFSSAPYHTILRWKIHKFSGKGHTMPRFSRLRRSTCDPQCSSGVDAHATEMYVLISTYNKEEGQ